MPLAAGYIMQPVRPGPQPSPCLRTANARARHQEALDSKWVPPVGGAPSRHTSTRGAGSWGTQGQGVEWFPDASSWASSQAMRCRAAEEMRGPPSGRAQEGRR
jgi:hypothetical protein